MIESTPKPYKYIWCLERDVVYRKGPINELNNFFSDDIEIFFWYTLIGPSLFLYVYEMGRNVIFKICRCIHLCSKQWRREIRRENCIVFTSIWWSLDKASEWVKVTMEKGCRCSCNTHTNGWAFKNSGVFQVVRHLLWW